MNEAGLDVVFFTAEKNNSFGFGNIQVEEGKTRPIAKMEGKRKERTQKCVAASLSVQLYVHVHVSRPGGLSGVCGQLAPISPLKQSSTGRLAAQERKQSLSNSRWRTACAFTAETHV